MTFHIPTLAALACLAAVPAFAGSSGGHSAQAVDHSGQAASHAGAAVASGAATAVSVPVIAVGATLAVTGSALEAAGESALDLGSEMHRSVPAPTHVRPVVVPNAAPTLD
ncbi:MAG: hypothetical protein AAF390_05870 [Pseudomonadota bacterium]